MHIVLVGPGALGSLLASMLSGAPQQGDIRITLMDHNRGRARQLQEAGIQYTHKQTEKLNHLPVSASPTETGPVDVVILCVKSYDITQCLGFCRPLFGRNTLVLFMQNGVAHLDASPHTGEASAAFGTTTEGANLLGQGRVNHAGKGLTQFGFLAPVSEPLQQKLVAITELFNSAGLKARISEDILSRLWTKLMVNSGINGLTATLGCTNGELLTLPGVPERMERLVSEAMAVANASGIAVPPDSLEITRQVCSTTSRNISSMLQDVRSKRRTEIDAINGAITATASKLNITTPENHALVRQVKELERGYLK